MNFQFLHCPLCKIEIPLITNLFLSDNTKIPYIDLNCKCTASTISLPVERYLDMITNKQCAKHKLIQNIICVKCRCKMCKMCYKTHLTKKKSHDKKVINVLGEGKKDENLKEKWKFCNEKLNIAINKRKEFEQRNEKIINDINKEIDTMIEMLNNLKSTINSNYEIQKQNDTVIDAFISLIDSNIKKSEFTLNQNLLSSAMFIINRISTSISFSFQSQIQNIKNNITTLFFSFSLYNNPLYQSSPHSNTIYIINTNFILNYASKHRYTSISPFLSHSSFIFTCLLLLKSNLIAIGTLQGVISLHCASHQIGEIVTGKNSITTLCQMSSGVLLSGNNKGVITLCDVDAMKCVDRITAHSANVLCIMEIDNDMFASSSYDATIRLWNLKNKNVIYTFYNTMGNAVNSLVLLPNERIVASMGGRYMKVISYRKMKWIESYEVDDEIDLIKKINDELICCLLLKGDIIIWDIKANCKKFILSNRDKIISIRNIANTLITLSLRGQIVFWDLSERQKVLTCDLKDISNDFIIDPKSNIFFITHNNLKCLY